MLQLSRQSLNILLFLLHVDVHLLGLRAQPRILVPRYVVLDLQIPVHVSDLFFLSLPENRCLVRLKRVALSRGRNRKWPSRVIVINSTTSPSWCSCLGCLGHGQLPITTEQNVATSVVVDDLLVDTVTFRPARVVREHSGAGHALVHGLDAHWVEGGAQRVLASHHAIRRRY